LTYDTTGSDSRILISQKKHVLSNMSLLVVGRRSRGSLVRILASFLVKPAWCVVVSMLWRVILRGGWTIWSLTAVIIVTCATVISPWRSAVATGSSKETHTATVRADLIGTG